MVKLLIIFFLYSINANAALATKIGDWNCEQYEIFNGKNQEVEIISKKIKEVCGEKGKTTVVLWSESTPHSKTYLGCCPGETQEKRKTEDNIKKESTVLESED